MRLFAGSQVQSLWAASACPNGGGGPDLHVDLAHPVGQVRAGVADVAVGRLLLHHVPVQVVGVRPRQRPGGRDLPHPADGVGHDFVQRVVGAPLHAQRAGPVGVQGRGDARGVAHRVVAVPLGDPRPVRARHEPARRVVAVTGDVAHRIPYRAQVGGGVGVQRRRLHRADLVDQASQRVVAVARRLQQRIGGADNPPVPVIAQGQGRRHRRRGAVPGIEAGPLLPDEPPQVVVAGQRQRPVATLDRRAVAVAVVEVGLRHRPVALHRGGDRRRAGLGQVPAQGIGVAVHRLRVGRALKGVRRAVGVGRGHDVAARVYRAGQLAGAVVAVGAQAPLVQQVAGVWTQAWVRMGMDRRAVGRTHIQQLGGGDHLVAHIVGVMDLVAVVGIHLHQVVVGIVLVGAGHRLQGAAQEVRGDGGPHGLGDQAHQAARSHVGVVVANRVLIRIGARQHVVGVIIRVCRALVQAIGDHQGLPLRVEGIGGRQRAGGPGPLHHLRLVGGVGELRAVRRRVAGLSRRARDGAGEAEHPAQGIVSEAPPLTHRRGDGHHLAAVVAVGGGQRLRGAQPPGLGHQLRADVAVAHLLAGRFARAAALPQRALHGAEQAVGVGQHEGAADPARTAVVGQADRQAAGVGYAVLVGVGVGLPQQTPLAVEGQHGAGQEVGQAVAHRGARRVGGPELPGQSGRADIGGIGGARGQGATIGERPNLTTSVSQGHRLGQHTTHAGGHVVEPTLTRSSCDARGRGHAVPHMAQRQVRPARRDAQVGALHAGVAVRQIDLDGEPVGERRAEVRMPGHEAAGHRGGQEDRPGQSQRAGGRRAAARGQGVGRRGGAQHRRRPHAEAHHRAAQQRCDRHRQRRLRRGVDARREGQPRRQG